MPSSILQAFPLLSGIDMHIVFLKNLLSLDLLPETANNELYHIK